MLHHLGEHRMTKIVKHNLERKFTKLYNPQELSDFKRSIHNMLFPYIFLNFKLKGESWFYSSKLFQFSGPVRHIIPESENLFSNSANKEIWHLVNNENS